MSALSPSPADAELGEGERRLILALAAATLFHGGLMPFTHGNTYDAFIHMFFADHYNRSWFDPWEPRWYTGFATTSYPPGTHMAIAALMHLMPLRAAFVLVMLSGLLLLVTGVYRFSKLWVHPRAAGYAALAAVLSSSISETIHLFGQLPTIFSLGVFLNGLPHVHGWIVRGGVRQCLAAVVFAAATTAAHHVTTIFGGVLFILPLAARALIAVYARRRAAGAGRAAALAGLRRPLVRGTVLAGLMLSAVILTVYPYWHWSISDPITQVPIPHGSRESFLERPDLGLVFFALPWGVALLFLPYAAYKTATSHLWPLGASLFLCVLLGTGGTTPIPRAILRGAFDILTLDRFTFWATILILPVLGLMFDSLFHGHLGRVIRAAFGTGIYRLVSAVIFIGMTVMVLVPAVLPRVQPMQPDFVDPAPIVRFMEDDEHDRWRYLTLGLGDQFAYLSAQMNAQSVDGNYHSARRLPDLTRFSVERLENAKYLGVPGLGSLRQFLVNADQYSLKFVFSNDAFYDPLLFFTGWTQLKRLPNGIVVWEKSDVPPLPLVQPRRQIPVIHALAWGIVPPAVLILAALVLALSALRRTSQAFLDEFPDVAVPDDAFGSAAWLRRIAVAAGLALLMGAAAGTVFVQMRLHDPLSPESAIVAYLDDLDFRRFDAAYTRLDPETRGRFEDILFGWRWSGGLLASYGKMSAVRPRLVASDGTIADWDVEIDWLTSIGSRTEIRTMRTVRRGETWYLAPTVLRPVQTPVRLMREGAVVWNVVGRRQPRPETDLHRDRLDRPRLALAGVRLIRRGERYSVVGQVTNADADPAVTTILASLVGPTRELARQTAGLVNTQRLSPAETAGFRIDFEGVLALDQKPSPVPTDIVEAEFTETPETAQITARALVHGQGLYRGVSLNAVRVDAGPSGPVISGLAVNTGTEIASIVRVDALFYDLGGRPLWADVGFVETNIYPGQSAPFRFSVPPADEIEVIEEIDLSAALINGRGMEADLRLPDARLGTVPMPSVTGYGALRLQVSSMTYEPLD